MGRAVPFGAQVLHFDLPAGIGRPQPLFQHPAVGILERDLLADYRRAAKEEDVEVPAGFVFSISSPRNPQRLVSIRVAAAQGVLQVGMEDVRGMGHRPRGQLPLRQRIQRDIATKAAISVSVSFSRGRTMIVRPEASRISCIVNRNRTKKNVPGTKTRYQISRKLK